MAFQNTRGGSNSGACDKSFMGGKDFDVNSNFLQAPLPVGSQARVSRDQPAKSDGQSLQMNPPGIDDRRERLDLRNKIAFGGRFRRSNQMKLNVYVCLFCDVPTYNMKGHLEHMATREHAFTVMKRGASLERRWSSLCKRVQEQSTDKKRKLNQAQMKFCDVCKTKFEGHRRSHMETFLHRESLFMTETKCFYCDKFYSDRFCYEKHLFTLDHIRNRHYHLMAEENYVIQKELLDIKPYRPDQVTGSEFVGDVRAFYCDICRKVYLPQDMSDREHSKSEEHYKKFKEYAKKKLAEKEKNPNKAKPKV